MEEKARVAVRERYEDLVFPDISLEPVWYGKRPDTKVDGAFAIVDQNEGTFFNFCSDQYQVVPYEDVISLIEEVTSDLPEFGKPTIVPHIFADGGKMKVKATFQDIEYEIKKGDIVNPKIEVYTSYDLGWKLRSLFGAYRLVCTNGLTVGKLFSKFAKRHMLSLNPEDMKLSIQGGMGIFSEQIGLWKKWAELQIVEELYDGIWKELPMSDGEKVKIEKLPEAGTQLLLPNALEQNQLTAWGFYSVVTQFVTHEIKSDIRREEIGPRVTQAFEKVLH